MHYVLPNRRPSQRFSSVKCFWSKPCLSPAMSICVNLQLSGVSCGMQTWIDTLVTL